MAIEYTIDGNSLKETYGVFVSKSKGLIGRPAIKAPRSVDYANETGKYVDLSRVKYQERRITLECFVYSDQKYKLISVINSLLAQLNKPGMHRLEVLLDGSRMMWFDVYNAGDSILTPEWHQSNHCGTFTLQLLEPYPHKIVYGRIKDVPQSSAVITAEQAHIHISWGDGRHDDIYGAGQITHTYDNDNPACIIVSGDIDEILKIEMKNCELLYSEL